MTTHAQQRRINRTRRLLAAPLHGGDNPVIMIDVFGTPRPQGSMTIWRDPVSGKERAKYSQTVYAWRGLITEAVRKAWAGPQIEGAIMVSVTFELPRPATHFGSGRNANTLRPSAPMYPAVGGSDLDKLVRCVLDAVTDAGTVWKDDAQVVRLVASKLFAHPPAVPGCSIRICQAVT